MRKCLPDDVLIRIVRNEYAYTVGISTVLFAVIAGSIVLDVSITSDRALGALIVIIILQVFLAFSFNMRLREIRCRLMKSDDFSVDGSPLESRLEPDDKNISRGENTGN